jgi:ATP-dependent Lhr-like helicase
LKDVSENVFSVFVKPVRRLLEQRGFQNPTEPQSKTIPKILEGKNVLLISPTATGKTESAMLPLLNQLIQMPNQPGIKVLYITPLRALNRDLLERLQWWCNNLDIKLAVRHGDTETKERTRQTRSPPDILITTPETLQAVLTGYILRQHLRRIQWVVVDEAHEMADNKRGSQLALALERLRTIADNEFQMIGLSATIGSPEKVAQFLVGNGRPVNIIRVPVGRKMHIEVLFPKPNSTDRELATALYTHPEVAARLRIIRKQIEKHNSVLLFTNTRSISEVLTSRFKIWDVDFPISIHHGSLAKPSRLAAERGLKNGELSGLVCTSSLELGLDIGRVDLVIQYMSPRQATRLIQRVGRSGHRVGWTARGIIITMDSDDTLEALAIGKMAHEETLEPVDIPEKPYDVLSHQIAGLLMKRRRLFFGDIVELFNKAYPYKDLTIEDVKKILSYMHKRFPRLAWVSFEDLTALRPRRNKALFEYYFDNLSMIPVEKQHIVIDNASDTAIGVLDEAFTAEYGKPGVKFIIRGSPWEILQVYGEKIYVKSVDDPTGAIPSWVGEEIPVPYKVSQEVGIIRSFVEKEMKKGKTVEQVTGMLTESYPANKDTLFRALQETFEQVKMGYPVPTNNRITVEDWEEFVIMHVNFGSLTNRALAQLIGYYFSEQIGYSVAVQHDPYRIFVRTIGKIKADDVVTLLEELKDTADESIREALTKTTVKTGLFKRRMIHVARRFGALKKWADFSSVSLTKLMKSFEGSVIYDEALKEVFTKDLDLQHLLQVIHDLKRSKFAVVKISRKEGLTPIAKVGVERVSMKTDLIPQEKMQRLLLESAKARLLMEVRSFVCTRCWDYLEMIQIKDLPDKPVCPLCGSNSLAILKATEDQARFLIIKKDGKFSKEEGRIRKKAIETAQYISRFGKAAAIVFSAKRIKLKAARGILLKDQGISDALFKDVIEAEQKALGKKFWAG